MAIVASYWEAFSRSLYGIRNLLLSEGEYVSGIMFINGNPFFEIASKDETPIFHIRGALSTAGFRIRVRKSGVKGPAAFWRIKPRAYWSHLISDYGLAHIKSD